MYILQGKLFFLHENLKIEILMERHLQWPSGYVQSVKPFLIIFTQGHLVMYANNEL